MRLPHALAPWQEYLDLVPREVLVPLWPLVQRLERLVGPLQAQSRSGAGEPDGFDGVARRGSYERLLASEWLLADEAPLEFARRASAGEHAFLQLARREPAGARVSFVLFDAGPNQLGTPRLAHLAALVVLARRAALAGARFAWSVAQHLEEPPRATVTPADVLHLFHARSPREAADAEVAGWREAHTAEDFWLVGGRRLALLPAARDASLLQVEDVLEPETRQLAVTAVRTGRAPRTVFLPLPDDATCTRLLRDPFGTGTAETVRADECFTPTSNLVFSGTGVKLLARTHEGLVVYPVPSSPRDAPAQPRLYAVGDGTILAAGRVKKWTLALTTAEFPPVLRVHGLDGKNAHRVAGRFQITLDTGPLPPGPAPLGPCLSVPGNHWGMELYTLVNRVLVGLMPARPDADGPVLPVKVQTAGVRAIAPAPGYPGGILQATKGAGGWTVTVLGPALATRNVEAYGDVGFFGPPGRAGDPQFGLFAVQRGNGTWLVLGAAGESTFAPPRGTTVVGVMGTERRRIGPGLVLLEADRRTVVVMGKDWTTTLPRPAAEVDRIAVSPAAASIAYATVTGEVGVYSVEHETMLYRLQTEGRG